MSTIPWLSILWLLPAAGATIIMLLPPAQRQLAKSTALVVAILVLVVAIIITAGFKTGGPPYQFVESHAWIPAFGTGYSLGVDGIALVLVLLTAALVPVLILAGWNDRRRPPPRAPTPTLR